MAIILDGTNGISDVDGSASTPAIRGTDANTGIFFPAADTIAFGEGGAEVARFDSSGNLGIGTSSPNSKLSVAVSSTNTSVLGSYANIPLLLQNTSNTDNNWTVIGVQDASGDFSSYIGTQNTSQSGNTAIMAFATNGGSGATERMRIDSSGNVSIGTSTNSVYDAVAASRPLVVQSSSSTTTQYGSTNSITICNSDTTTNNASQLNFAAITGASANQYSSAVISCIYGARTNAQYPTGILTFGTSSTTNTAPSEKMRITSPGKILFNTTTQNNNEQVGMVYSSNDGAGFSIKDSNAQNGNTFIEFRNGATLAGTITSNGTTTMTYGSASDYRLKSNPQPIQNALATVSALNPVSFTWNQTGEQGIGFIAHEVQAVMPDCVVGQKDAEDDNGNPLYQMIDTGSASLIATLTAAIQELKSELDAAKARIAVLEAK